MGTGKAAGGAGAGPRRAAPAGLVGRDDLLAQLRVAATPAAAGRGGLVLLTGEAGIGKTAVATAAAADAEARGARVAWGWGWQGEGAPAWWPWVQVLRSLTAADERLRRLAAGLPWPARLLPDLPGAVPSSEAGELAPAARFRLLDELTSVLLAAAEDRPLVVVLDDLQWADPPSLELLGFLARRLPAARVLVLGTWRELDQPPGDPRAPLLADLAAAGTAVPMRPSATTRSPSWWPGCSAPTPTLAWSPTCAGGRAATRSSSGRRPGCWPPAGRPGSRSGR